MDRLEQLRELSISTDEVLELFSREELLSALGFDRASDYLDEVTIGDAVDYYGSELIDHFDINDYWDAESAYDRYGSDLLDFFEGYYNTDDWGASDHIDNYGDSSYMLEVLLEQYVGVETVSDKIKDTIHQKDIERLIGLLGGNSKSKHKVLVDFMRAHNEVLTCTKN